MRVLIDTDPGLGANLADVDDGLAIFFMLNNSQFEVEGITVVFGNTPVRQGYRLVKKYLNLASKTAIPHYLGSRSKDELGKINDASKFLIKKVKENPSELTLLTLGPLTNIATALKYYPEFLDDIKEIVIMGGLIYPQPEAFSSEILEFFKQNLSNVCIETEMNFFKDPFATKSIIEAETTTPRILMSLDICCKVIFTKEHIKKIESVNKPIPQFMTKFIKNWYNLNIPNKKGGFYPFDTFVPIYALKPELFKTRDLYFTVDTDEILGKLTILGEKKENSAPITCCTDFVDSNGDEEFMDILVSGLIK